MANALSQRGEIADFAVASMMAATPICWKILNRPEHLHEEAREADEIDEEQPRTAGFAFQDNRRLLPPAG